MKLVIINRPNGRYSVLDNGKLILEDCDSKAVEDFFVDKLRLGLWDHLKTVHVTDIEYAVLSGKVKCCDCGEPVTKYNTAWKDTNQRCERCKK